MPDLLFVFTKRWKLILAITFVATVIAFVVALLSPKQYMAVATALPANSLIADRNRIFNQNIQELYSEFGMVDELDKLEGTGKLDTLFIAAAEEFSLDQHYKINPSGESMYSAALKLKKNSKINRSGYGELRVKVWDRDRNLAAQLANFLMQKIQELHQHLQNESTISVLTKIKEAYAAKQKQYIQLEDSISQMNKAKQLMITEQMQEYGKMIDQYQLAINANAPVLLIVENARPPLWPDKPKVMATVLFTLFSALVFSFLIALFIESRKTSA
jgi:capsular polysaccharide biosynthesis protein